VHHPCIAASQTEKLHEKSSFEFWRYSGQPEIPGACLMHARLAPFLRIRQGKPDHLWASIANLAKSQSSELL
jgi:hypothetical protein